jgi:prepilin-type N-terminal cleavage/methylation domain-containing protein
MYAKRSAFTLIEMLVVLTIIALIGALIAFVMPGFQERSRAAKGGQALQGWLNYARQRALFEQAPRGIRFLVISPNASTGGAFVMEAQYLEQPDDFTGGEVLIELDSTGTPNPPLNAKIQGADLTQIEIGDYFEIFGTGQMHRISNINLTTTPPTVSFNSSPLAYPISASAPVRTTNYRILRQPRVTGDEPMKLSEGIIIDLAKMFTYQQSLGSAYAGYRPNTIDTSGAGTSGYFDVIFAPSGMVLHAPGDKLIFWVRTEDGANEFAGNPTLVAVSTNSGAVAAYAPVGGTNPYINVR